MIKPHSETAMVWNYQVSFIIIFDTLSFPVLWATLALCFRLVCLSCACGRDSRRRCSPNGLSTASTLCPNKNVHLLFYEKLSQKSSELNYFSYRECRRNSTQVIACSPQLKKCYTLHTYTHTRLTALFPGLPRWAGTRKAKPIWILLKQETVSGSGISWAICKSASRSRQTKNKDKNAILCKRQILRIWSNFHCFLQKLPSVRLQCFDAVGWAAGRASGL